MSATPGSQEAEGQMGISVQTMMDPHASNSSQLTGSTKSNYWWVGLHVNFNG